MKLQSTDIKKLTALAKLKINSSEADLLVTNLSSVLSWVSTLQTADTKNVLPLTHPLKLSQLAEKESATNDIAAEDVYKNAPEFKKSHFIVPKVLD